MMRLSEIEHSPVKVLFDYFERAVGELGLNAWASLLRPGTEEQFQKRVSSRVLSTLEFAPWEDRREAILREPEEYLRWEPWEDPEEEIWAHYRLQSAIVVTLLGDGKGSLTPLVGRLYRDGKGLRSLSAQLVVEPMNRKLEIGHFLGNLTDGRVGMVYPELPSRAQILQWVREIDQVQLTNRLPEIARFKYQ